MIVVVTTLRVKPDKAATFDVAVSEFLKLIRENEPGTVFYTIAKSREEAGLYRGVEVYKDRAAQEQHMNASYFGETARILMDCLEAAPTFTTHDSLD